ncbi:exported protein of unknown function [Nitrospira defluvii]|uniref:Uncharacterized protein n=1 Tax=Nitrospira defluvii TaxID=330214 RepID=D8PE27_9BACT|nr:exported protein of unknown function [Nitrospira defluvii]
MLAGSFVLSVILRRASSGTAFGAPIDVNRKLDTSDIEHYGHVITEY